MRAWDETEEVLRRRAERRAEEDAETLDELAEHGVDLDPGVRRGAGGEPVDGGAVADSRGTPAAEGTREAPARATHRHGDIEHASDHVHPHAHAGPDDKPVVGIVGAGAVGTALGVALSRAGWPVGAVASRDPARRARFGELVPGVRAFAEPTALIDDVELVVLAVPDDVVEPLARGLRLYAGQAIVHTSGLLGAEVLEPAMAAGTQAGAFHPLVAFADLDRALEALNGATIAIEGDDELAAHLGDMAEAIGGTPVRLAPGSKAAYHAAAVLSAGGVVALLDAVREVAAAVGLDEAGALRIYLPLLEQTVANARTLGIERSLTGPATRGDAGTIVAHRAAIAADAPGAMDVYRALLARDVDVAERRGALSPEASERLRTALARDP
jgi:predicted short-subunit dehydrogenase-like oxidoreductase (DUF2520 family)